MTNAENNKKGRKKLPLFLDSGLPVVQEGTKTGFPASVNRPDDSYKGISEFRERAYQNPLLGATAFKLMCTLDPVNARLVKENIDSYEAFLSGASYAAEVLGRAIEDNGLALLAELDAISGFDNPLQLREVLLERLGVNEVTRYSGILNYLCQSYLEENAKNKSHIATLVSKEHSPVDPRGPAKEASERYWGVSETG